MESLISIIKGSNNTIDWDTFKVALNNYNFSYKEDDNLGLVYYEDNSFDTIPEEEFIKSCVIEKKTMKMIATQFNNIIYNKDTMEKIKGIPKWDTRISIQECYEGTLIMVFYYDTKWYITTRRCLDAKKSLWTTTNYYDLFNEAKKFNIDDLNKNYFYHFVLIHNRNKNIVDYEYLFGKDYKELVHVMTVDKNSMKEMDYEINGCVKSKTYEFKTLDELLEHLKVRSEEDIKNSKITTEGVIVKLDKYYIMKLQTDIYQYLSEMKPNNSNIERIFLELYQKDRLNDFIRYFSENPKKVIYRIHKSMKTISVELLNIYHQTRNKQNPKLYNVLPASYRKALYELHGTYISRKKEVQYTHITSYDVYEYLKNIDTHDLLKIYFERDKLIKEKIPYIRTKCIFTRLQTDLMFV